MSRPDEYVEEDVAPDAADEGTELVDESVGAAEDES